MKDLKLKRNLLFASIFIFLWIFMGILYNVDIIYLLSISITMFIGALIGALYFGLLLEPKNLTRDSTNFIIINKEKIYSVDRVLFLMNKSITDIEEIQGLEQFKNLEGLNLENNEITEMKGLEFFKKLKMLNLSGNQIKEIKKIKQLKNLRELYLSNNYITEIKSINNLKKLEILDLSFNQITETPEIQILSNLKLFNFDGNPIS